MKKMSQSDTEYIEGLAASILRVEEDPENEGCFIMFTEKNKLVPPCDARQAIRFRIVDKSIEHSSGKEFIKGAE